MKATERIVRVVLPVDLIRKIDQAILAGNGGYQTRTELVRDAVEAYVLELTHEPAPDEPLTTTAPGDGGVGRPEALPPLREQNGTGYGLEFTVVRCSSRGATIQGGDAEVSDEVLFGLHNRDFSTVWALGKLADLTRGGPVPLHEFRAHVVTAAWQFAARLLPLEKRYGGKLTALFPTNKKRPESASDTFFTFAVGACEENGAKVRASGPIYLWRAAQVVRRDGRLLVGLTDKGYDLLESLDGISLELPHGPELAERFLLHLHRHAPADWWGFRNVLEAVEPGITRAELIAAFQRLRPDWTPTQASTIASGYVARAREWGLAEPKLQGGRYVLTEVGIMQLQKEKERDYARV